MLNLKAIIKIFGLLLIVEGIALLLSLGVAIIYRGHDITPLLKSSLICLVTGTLTFFAARKADMKLHKNDGFIIMSMSWILFSIFGSLPYLLSNTVPGFTDAFFESMSGFTTTGSTILTDPESVPKGILFWRSLTQWIGGLGIILLAIIALPLFGIGGMNLFTNEIPGSGPDRMNPKIQQNLFSFMAVYLLFTAIETILLVFGGMSLFDAVNHSFTTISTGGFSTKHDSIAHWNVPFIQYVIIFFMVLGGTNFTLVYCLVTGKFEKILKNEEFKYYLFFIVVFTAILFSGLLLTSSLKFNQVFRNALFQVVSILTTTGFVTTDYLLWSPVLMLLLFILFFFGASNGSTGSSIKVVRIVLLLKNSYYQMRRLLHPNAVIPVRLNKRTVPEQLITNVLTFFMIYFSVVIAGAIVFAIIEPDFYSAIGAVSANLGNIGPGLGSYGPFSNYQAVPDAGKWFLSFLMLLGRLEIFAVLILFSPAFWRK